MHQVRKGVCEAEQYFSCPQDIRTYVALNESSLAETHPNVTDAREIWGYYPDDWPLKGLHAGDTRAALTPFLAHQVCNLLYPSL